MSWSLITVGVTADQVKAALRAQTEYLTQYLSEMEDRIVAEIDTQLTEYGNQVKAALDEAGAEWSAQLTDLQDKLNAALANSGTGINSIADLSPEAAAALDAARARAEGLADRVPGHPGEQPPAEEPPVEPAP